MSVTEITTTSWWARPQVQQSHTAFREALHAELPRMQASKAADWVSALAAAQVRERGSMGMGGHRKGRFGGVTVSR